MKNDLIAAPADQTHWYTGLGIAESIADIASGVESENWVETGIGTFAAAAEAAAWATDPLGQLIQYGVSWLMEQIKPLRDALDWLAGDPPQIEAYAQTWRNVSTSVTATATSLLGRSRADTTTWHGAAGDAYRSYAGALAQAVADTAKTAELIGHIVSIAGMLVAAVRELVRDLIAELVAILLERVWVWAVESATGVGAAAARAQIAALAAKWVGKVARVIAKLCRSLNNLKGLTDKLDEIWDLLTKAWRRFREGKTAKPGLPTKGPITGPGTKPPRVADGSTSPSSTTRSGTTSKPDPPDANKPSKDRPDATVPSGGGGSGNKPPRGNGPGLASSGEDPEDSDGGNSSRSNRIDGTTAVENGDRQHIRNRHRDGGTEVDKESGIFIGKEKVVFQRIADTINRGTPRRNTPDPETGRQRPGTVYEWDFGGIPVGRAGPANGGGPLYKIRVIVDDGKVVTAFPF